MIYVVTGPPAAGKSTWTRDRAKPGDITIDFDSLAVALTPQPTRDPLALPSHVMAVVRAARNAAIEAALVNSTASPSTDVYIIDSMPKPAAMRDYCAHRAQIIVVDPGRAECLRRADAERSPRQRELSREWYAARNL